MANLNVPFPIPPHAPFASFDAPFPNQTGVSGSSSTGTGVSGSCDSSSNSAIFGINNGTGEVPKFLKIPAGNGVWGHTKVQNGSGVYGSVEPGLTRDAAGVTGNGPVAGRFFGDVEVNGNVTVTGDIQAHDVVVRGGDCAEDFEISGIETVEPGTVMVIEQHGSLKICESAYDKRVAGVVSGAGDFKPGLILDRQQFGDKRMPIALVGKVYCKVDAQYGAIEVGDLLTTSPTPGHAMKMIDTLKAFGAVLGKALRPLESGTGLIPILIALQ
jgi:hypothetical protein